MGALRRAKRREKTIGRGTPLCVPFPGPNAERRQTVGAPLVGALRGLLWRPNLDAIALKAAAARWPECAGNWSDFSNSLYCSRAPV